MYFLGLEYKAIKWKLFPHPLNKYVLGAYLFIGILLSASGYHGKHSYYFLGTYSLVADKDSSHSCITREL